MAGRFFHGGQRGLKVGGLILPPTITQARCTSDIIPNRVHRRDRVYVTPDEASAVMYAVTHRDQTIYEVEPLGTLEHDDDCNLAGLSFACDKAKILSVRKVPGKLIKRARKALLSP
jgi:rifampin ADP-ribosylating transferase